MGIEIMALTYHQSVDGQKIWKLVSIVYPTIYCKIEANLNKSVSISHEKQAKSTCKRYY